ncbi:DsbA family protein [Psychromicrobium xiongbiense]|uniref:DsbA family protein n=1 Tax=Psychromicrobium xiongbiense TaxID=3051184 RepID=UPI00255374A1|nr:thioredoxin domain-containing protein [Psychromicrobium sp. YIM S02556]
MQKSQAAGHPKLSKNQRVAAAREAARQAEEAAKLRQRRHSWLLRGGVVAAAIVVAVVIALVVVNSLASNPPIADQGPAPAQANAYGGVVLGAEGVIVPPATGAGTIDKSTVAPQPNPLPTEMTDLPGIGITPAAAGKPVPVVVYLDFICPFCKQFEGANGAYLKKLQEAGTITVEYRVVGVLDNMSTSLYSSRAAAAAACVLDAAPQKYDAYFTALFAQQPAEGSGGLSSDQLKTMARNAGVNVDSCIDNRTFRPWVQWANAQARAHGISLTPSVFVDGKQMPATSQDFQAFAQPLIDAKAAAK